MRQQIQNPEEISREDLINTVHSYHDNGYRLVQISCADVGGVYELTYTFDKEMAFSHIRMTVRPDQEVQSISQVYLAAFVYENEIADFFGLQITGIAIDYKGTFFRTTIAHPFKTQQIAVVKKQEESHE